MCSNHNDVLGKHLTSVLPFPNFFADTHHTVPVHPALQPHPKVKMNISLAAAPIVSLLAGILILVVPRLLNYIVAIYLIVIGLLGLFPHLR